MAQLPEVYESLDLALRVGEVLLSSGAGAADVATTMLAVTHACGLRNVSADVTFVDLTLHHQPSNDKPVTIRVRRVTRRRVDYADLTEVDQTVGDLLDGVITRDEARDQVARIVSTGHQRRSWTVTLGWGVMGTAVALTLGGSPEVCLLAFLTACVIDLTQRGLSRHRIPSVYVQAAGGFLATVIAMVAAATPLEVNPSRVVTTGIVMLLAGIGLMGATQDAITGFPVTASARMLDAMMDTAGIIAGVAAGLTVGDVLGVGLESFNPGAAGLAAAGVSVFGAGLAAAGFAFASYAPLRSVLAAGLVGALGQAILLSVDSAELGRAWGSAAAAVTIGAFCYLVAGRFRVPPLVVVVPAIVPLLPGLDIYRGLALFATGNDGILPLASALATAFALAAGVILGQYLAQPLKREAHRLETRLSGPRMVGPLRRLGAEGTKE
jgi:uncharacterized membrane protein YjjP (DUF1212 family)